MTFLLLNKLFPRLIQRTTLLFNLSISRNNQTEKLVQSTKLIHCYKELFPWTSNLELAAYLASTITYNKGGLIALNKPFGIKIHGHDKPGARSKGKQKFIIPTVSECDLTVEDTLDDLKHILNEPKLTILKSSEKYSSGLVLLSTNEEISAAVKKSFVVAKTQKIPHLIHWFLTLGYPVQNCRKEKVGIHFVESEDLKKKQPVIVREISKRSIKLKKVYPVHVEFRTINVNSDLNCALVEISTSSVKWHFVRVYAAYGIASILGDILYSNRMNSLLGMPVKLHIEQAQSFDMPPISDEMAATLNLPKGVQGHSSIPTMLHLRSIFLPFFQGKDDIVITANLPTHFEWTAERLKLLPCK